MPVRLRLQSKEFVFESGEVVAIPLELAAEGGLEAWVDRIRRTAFRSIVDNAIELVDVIRAGDYLLQMGNLTVQRVSDHLTVSVPMFAPLLSVTAEDLKRGSVDLEIQTEGLFKVIVTNRNLQPVPHGRLTFLANAAILQAPPKEPFRLWSMSVEADEKGVFFFLGNPCLWWIQLDSGTGLSIVSV